MENQLYYYSANSCTNSAEVGGFVTITTTGETIPIQIQNCIPSSCNNLEFQEYDASQQEEEQGQQEESLENLFLHDPVNGPSDNDNFNEQYNKIGIGTWIFLQQPELEVNLSNQQELQFRNEPAIIGLDNYLTLCNPTDEIIEACASEELSTVPALPVEYKAESSVGNVIEYQRQRSIIIESNYEITTNSTTANESNYEIVNNEQASSNDNASKIEGTHICRICGKGLVSRAAMRSHERRHNEVKEPLPCPICNKTFSSKDVLRVHKKEIHREDEKLCHSCPVCHKQFVRRRNLLEHLKRNLHPSVEIPKAVSGRKKVDKTLMKTPQAPKEFKYECEICKNRFRSRYNLKIHYRVHTSDRPFQCPHCPMALRSSGNLKGHIESHMNVIKYVSKYCEHGFRSAEGWRRHNKIHEDQGICKFQPYRIKHCNVCSEPFATPFLFQKHFQEKHDNHISAALPILHYSEEITIPEITCIDDQSRQEAENSYQEIESCQDLLLIKLALTSGTDIISCIETNTVEQRQFPNPEFTSAAEVNLKLCQLCGKNISKDLFFLHFHREHNKSLTVNIDRMLFKPMVKTNHSSISVVKPASDNLYLPWFLCTKCGRTFAESKKALAHKITCANKCKFKVRCLRDFGVQKESQSQCNTAKSFIVLQMNLTEKDVVKGAWMERWDEDLRLVSVPQEDSRIKICDRNKFQCLVCEKIVGSLFSAKKHCMLHDEKKWKCDECSALFHFERDFNGHMRKHTGEKPYPCRTCGKPFRLPVLRYVHEQFHLPVELRKTRYQKISRPPCRTSKFVCDKCAGVFVGTHGLNHHMAVMHPPDGIKPRPFTCNLCDKKFTSASHVRKHLRSVHKTAIPIQLLKEDKVIDSAGNVHFDIEDLFTRDVPAKHRGWPKVQIVTSQRIS